ncbi:peptidase dimerization domain-containing protein [[Brevibacterium] frigoritolerans]|uniref:Peptidase dimerization domain-containing protein n=1 Tax=Peribacillus frigoritolerans TaxID=450367 RepID=A0A941FQT5_9BACI|nr:peptidase dimerization domain-containing protein [Peribacillus frigoritolerans]
MESPPYEEGSRGRSTNQAMGAQGKRPPEPCQLLYNTEWLLSQSLGNPLLSQLLYRPSYNPGIIQGGTNVNVVADKCIIKVDTRVPFGMKPEFVLDIARNLVSAVAPGAVVDPMVPCTNPNWTLEDRPIVRAMELGIQRVLGMEEPVFSVLCLVQVMPVTSGAMALKPSFTVLGWNTLSMGTMSGFQWRT